MRVEIKLKDPKSCEGCPCLMQHPHYNPFYRHYTCGEGYYHMHAVEKKKYPKRPKRCVEDNGE